MAISFTQTPTATRLPRTMVEIDGTSAVPVQGAEPHRVLIVGQRLSTGTVAQAVETRIGAGTDADAYFGIKSDLAAVCRAYRRVNTTADVWAMGLDDAGGGVAATCTFPLTGTATADGVLRVRVGDTRISISVLSGATHTDTAVALAAALNADTYLMFSAAAGTGTVTLTCSHKGPIGNNYTLEVEAIPAGLACTPTQPSNGATVPGMSTAVDAFDASTRYDTILTSFSDDTSLDAFEAEMELRWGPTVKQPGMVIAAVRGAHGTLTTAGNARNSQFSCLIGTGLSPTLPGVFAAQCAARDAQRCDTQPNRPRNGMSLPDCEAPAPGSRFSDTERNLLLYDGISTFKVNSAGNCLVERMITTWQTNANGSADSTYLAMETQRNLAKIYLEAVGVGNKYGNFNVAPNGTQVEPGVAVLTPAAFRGELIAWYDTLIKRGLAKDAEGFAADLLVEINAIDGERLDVHMAPRLVNSLVTIAFKISFQL